MAIVLKQANLGRSAAGSRMKNSKSPFNDDGRGV